MIEFTVNGIEITKPDEKRTVSVAALFLLRTVSHSHSKESPVAESNLLIPYTGHTAWVCGERFPVMVMGDDSWGFDPEITHIDNDVRVQFKSSVTTVSIAEWASAVVGFAEQVKAFYDHSSPKIKESGNSERQGREAFWLEWDQRLRTAKQVAGSS